MDRRKAAYGGEVLKILEVCHYYLPHSGGVEQHVLSLKSLLEARGHTVDVWSTAWPQSKADRTFRPWITPMANPITPSLLPAILRADYDVVHAHVHYSFAAWASLLTHSPLVLTCHGTVLPFKSAFQTIFDWTMGRIALQRPNVVVALSNSQQKAISNLGARRTIVIPQWTDLPVRPRSHGINILFVGRLIPSKGVLDLWEAVRGLDATVTAIGGEVAAHRAYAAECRRTAPPNVTLIGNVPHDQMPDFYAASDLFVLPTLGEGSSISLLEAMAAGCCPVVSDVPSCNEVVTPENGYLVPPRSPMLRNAIERLLGHPDERLRLADRARQSVPLDVAARYEELFDSLRHKVR